MVEYCSVRYKPICDTHGRYGVRLSNINYDG